MVQIYDKAIPHEPTYSSIISPEEYNRTITHEHIYIQQTDNYMQTLITELTLSGLHPEVIEIGCGPGRLLPLIGGIPHIRLTAIDYDENFVSYAKTITQNLPINIISGNFLTYHHPKPVAVFYSQGVHHHIAKGAETLAYLQNVYAQLQPGGYYIKYGNRYG